MNDKMLSGCLQTLVFLFAAQVAGSGGGIIRVAPRFHDSEGYAGLPTVTATYEQPTNKRIEVWFPESTTPWIDETRLGAVGTNFDDPPGTPLLFRSSSDQTGVFAGYSALNWFYETAADVFYVLPINGSELGMYVFESDFTSSVKTACTISFFIVEDTDSPSLMIAAEDVPQVFGRGVSATIEYLPGNSNESIGSQSVYLPNGAGYSAIGLFWPAAGGQAQPYQVDLNTPPPEGLTRISVAIDGYTTNTITLNMQTQKIYQYGAIIEGSNPGAIGPNEIDIINLPATPPASLRQRAIAWLITAYCERFSNMQQHMIGNEDASWDVADVVHQNFQQGEARP